MKILNLYAGIGGNRKLWGGDIKVVAVENDPDIAAVYAQLFTDDTVIVADAHDYLLKHYKEFDFIWSSPPCPSHGQYRFNVGFKAKGYAPLYPDMKLYEEIIFLKHYYSGIWLVENVVPFYEPLVKPTAILQRHLFWSNSPIDYISIAPKKLRTKNKISDYGELGEMIKDTKISNKRQVLRNCVDPELGLHVFTQLCQDVDIKQETTEIFENRLL